MPTSGLPVVDGQADCVFVTWRLHEHQEILTAPERTLVCETIEHHHEQRYRLGAYVVMDDYIHIVMQLREEFELWEVIQGWKWYTANRLQRTFGRRGSIWQLGYYGRPLKSKKQIEQALLCVATNPQRQWPNIPDYRWFRAFGSYVDLLPNELKPRELRDACETTVARSASRPFPAIQLCQCTRPGDDGAARLKELSAEEVHSENRTR